MIRHANRCRRSDLRVDSRARAIRREKRRVAHLRRRPRPHPLFAARSDQRVRTSTSWKSPGASRPTTSARAPNTSSKRTPLDGATASSTPPPDRAAPWSRSMPPPASSCGSHGENEGTRGSAAPRQLSGRGLAYWTDGKEERILYVTPGYRLIALDAKTGAPVPSFGAKRRGRSEARTTIRTSTSITGEVGLHSTPIVAGRRGDHRRRAQIRRRSEELYAT